jgi:glycerophosphoryl diester phosphodiesterase
VAARFDGLDLDARFGIDRGFVEQVHAAGLKLFTWTVDDPALAWKQAAAGVNGITTNRPAWMRERLMAFQ